MRCYTFSHTWPFLTEGIAFDYADRHTESRLSRIVLGSYGEHDRAVLVRPLAGLTAGKDDRIHRACLRQFPEHLDNCEYFLEEEKTIEERESDHLLLRINTANPVQASCSGYWKCLAGTPKLLAYGIGAGPVSRSLLRDIPYITGHWYDGFVELSLGDSLLVIFVDTTGMVAKFVVIYGDHGLFCALADGVNPQSGHQMLDPV